MQKNTEYIPNRDVVSAAILQHLDGLRGIDTHCHHLPDDQFQNMGLIWRGNALKEFGF